MERYLDSNGDYNWRMENNADTPIGEPLQDTQDPLLAPAMNSYRQDRQTYYAPTPLVNSEISPAHYGQLINGGYTIDLNVPQLYNYTIQNQMVSNEWAPRSSTMRRSKSHVPQRTRSQGGYEEGYYAAQQVGLPMQNLPKHSHWEAASAQPTAGYAVSQQQKYTAETQRYGGNIPYGQIPSYQGTIGNLNYQNGIQSRRELNPDRDTSMSQGPLHAPKSAMQYYVGRMMREPPPSTLTTSSSGVSAASGSSGGTFSSVSSGEYHGPRHTLDASQPSNLGYEFSQLHLRDNPADIGSHMQRMHPSRSSHGVHAHENASYGQMQTTPTTRYIPQQDTSQQCHACMRLHSCHHSHQHQLHGDHAAGGEVRIGYCPIRGCNRGPGSNRPFPRTCNLLEHLRGVHREEIPKGAKLRVWLLEQGYDPDALVEYVKPRH